MSRGSVLVVGTRPLRSMGSGTYEYCMDYGLWLRTMGGPHAVPRNACLALSCPYRADTTSLFRFNTPSAQVRLADIVCQPTMVP